MTEAVYEIRNLSVIRGENTLIDDISLEVASGEVTVILGPNGAGKSTLVGVMAGDIPPDRGTVRFRNREMREWSARDLARQRAVLPQSTFLQFAFRAEEVVAMGRSALPPASPQQEHEAITAAMTHTETAHLRERLFPQLSGGEQSRVSFARVLTQSTPVILLDEPTASLDLRHQHDVMTVARGIARDGGTVVAIVHDINLAFTYADRLVLMDEGRIAAVGTPWEVADQSVLQQTFGCPMVVMQHPYLNCPLVLSTSEIPL
ncbi:MAG: heme ABC transporter ATP-binding protein [Thermomicrobiales bacterium]|nr:heme ABC transporter ATP-binding protein [Thermomicrobiales bacterium]